MIPSPPPDLEASTVKGAEIPATTIIVENKITVPAVTMTLFFLLLRYIISVPGTNTMDKRIPLGEFAGAIAIFQLQE